MIVLLWASLGFAASLDEGRLCLRLNDVPCAEEVVKSIGAAESSDPSTLVFAADTAFYAGRSAEAVTLMGRAVDAGFSDRWDQLAHYKRTATVQADWTSVTRGQNSVHYAPGLDAILVDDALQTLQICKEHLAPLMGGPPPGVMRLEIYPDGRSFIAASSLTEDAVRTTGVVGLSKWSHLLITSPRALGRGYGWQDTVAHEYIHLVIAHQTADRAPVWLQESIAKYLDNSWRDGGVQLRLSVRQQSLLGTALVEDSLVTVEEMGNSLANMESAERSTLAYAQLATLMDFSVRSGGDDLLLRLLPRVRAGEDPHEALAKVAGFSDWPSLEAAWLADLKTQRFTIRAVAAMPKTLDGDDDFDADPVLSRREDLARWMRLGDLLADRGHHQAARVEYEKARPKDEPPSPLLSARLASAMIAKRDYAEARRELEASVSDYPEFALTYRILGELCVSEGRQKEAIAHYVQAAALDPFEVETQVALESLYKKTGQIDEAARRARYLQILSRGGEG